MRVRTDHELSSAVCAIPIEQTLSHGLNHAVAKPLVTLSFYVLLSSSSLSTIMVQTDRSPNFIKLHNQASKQMELSGQDSKQDGLKSQLKKLKRRNQG